MSLLRPVIRFCLSRSVKIQELLELVKKVFLEVAEESIERDGHSPSVSRLSVVTGIHRKDIDRIQKTEKPPEKGQNIAARVLGHWQGHKKFKTSSGKPKALSCEGPQSEFAKLVKGVSKELNPYTVLFELERVGAVRRQGKKVSIISRTFIPKGDVEEGFRLLSNDTEDLLQAVSENVFQEPEVPNLHIKTEYDNIPARLIPEIRQWVLDAGSAFSQQIRNYLSRMDRDINPELPDKGESVRIAVGVFSRVDNSSGENLEYGLNKERAK